MAQLRVGEVAEQNTYKPVENMTAPHRPQPAYEAPSNSPILSDPSLVDRLAKSTASRRLITSFTLPPRSGRAWTAPAGSIVRLSTPDGPQVGDLNVWSQHNPRERFWAARTRQIHASHVSVGDRLWSCLPYLRPMVTIVADSIGERFAREHGGPENHNGRKGFVDEWGGGCHDLLGTRCDPYVNKLLTTTLDAEGNVAVEGEEYDFHCHSNLTRAVLPFGLAESDVHDVINVFQVTGLDEQGRYCMRTCPAIAGDYFEFFAEIDVLCALSTCPGGDLSAWGWDNQEGLADSGKKSSMLECCRPLKVEVFSLDDSQALDGWKPPRPSNYRRVHGMHIPSGEPTM